MDSLSLSLSLSLSVCVCAYMHVLCTILCLSCLHVDVTVISRFAQFEFKHGEPARGRTMFESILSSYPRRVDIWSVYIDMVVKMEEDLKQAR